MCRLEVSDWTFAAGAVLETLMQHQKWSSPFHGGGGGGGARQKSEVKSPRVSRWSDMQPKFKFPNI